MAQLWLTLSHAENERECDFYIHIFMLKQVIAEQLSVILLLNQAYHRLTSWKVYLLVFCVFVSGRLYLCWEHSSNDLNVREVLKDSLKKKKLFSMKHIL